MDQFEIFTDSAANLPDEVRLSRNINVIPYICNIDGEDVSCLEEGVPYAETAKKFYAKMREGAEAKTSLIGQDRISDAFIPFLEEGKDIVFVSIASGISGTYQQALNAQKELSEKYPKRKIYVVDSANASLGEGLIVLRIADLRDMGESAESCYEWGVNNAYKVNSYLTVEDLKYLRKGGRISKTLALAGSLLNIKPLIKADGGKPAKMTFFSKTRGRKKAISALVEYFDAQVVRPEGQTVAIAHGDCEEEALELAQTLKDHGAHDVIVEYYDMCTGTHVGPGTIAIFFFGKDRRTETPATETAPSLNRAPKTSNV